MADDVAALVRLLRDSGTANPDAVALEVIQVLKSRGWRRLIEPPPPPRPRVDPPAEFLAAKAAIHRAAP